MAANGDAGAGDASMQNEGIFKDVCFAIIPSADLKDDAAHKVR